MDLPYLVEVGCSRPARSRTVERGASLPGEVYPQIACRPIVMRISMTDPTPLAEIDEWKEVLARPRAERAALYQDTLCSATAPRRRQLGAARKKTLTDRFAWRAPVVHPGQLSDRPIGTACPPRHSPGRAEGHLMNGSSSGPPGSPGSGSLPDRMGPCTG